MPDEPRVMHHIGAQQSVRGEGAADEAIAELAERQHGVVARSQLRALGLGRGAIAARLRTKRLHRMHRGVYAVGHRRVSRLGWWLAAVLACGPDAVLSHRCAAALWGILEGWPVTVDISAPRRLAPRAGMRIREAAIAADERTVHAGIPVTTVARTLLDLAAVLQPHELDRVLERAEAMRLSDRTPLVALIERHHRRRGTKNLKGAVKEGLRPAVTRSELERRFLSFIDKAQLPRPQTNRWLQIGGEWLEVDCVWPAQRVIVELDSRAYHQTTAAFERDRKRDRAQAAGWRVLRVTDQAMREEGRPLREELTALLTAGRARSA
jgi:very-short-patch-repair endonuclease